MARPGQTKAFLKYLRRKYHLGEFKRTSGGKRDMRRRRTARRRVRNIPRPRRYVRPGERSNIVLQSVPSRGIPAGDAGAGASRGWPSPAQAFPGIDPARGGHPTTTELLRDKRFSPRPLA